MSVNDEQPDPVARPDLVPVWQSVVEDIDRRYPLTSVASKGRRLVDLVLADMRERDQIGRARYGTPLTTNNGRDHLVDAYQELLDAAVYSRAAFLEGEKEMELIYDRVIHDIIIVRRFIEDRREKQL